MVGRSILLGVFFGLFFMACCFMPKQMQAQKKITSLIGLVAYYPLDGNANDQGKHALHGEVYGEVINIKDRFNKPTSAMWFTGKGSYIEIPHHEIFDLKQFSVSVWFYDSLSVQNPILSKGSVIKSDSLVSNQRQYNIYSCNKKDSLREDTIREDIKFDLFDSNLNRNSTYSNKKAELEMWHHLVITYSVREAKIYLNGELMRRNYINKPVVSPNTPGPLIVGASFIQNQLNEVADTIFRVGGLDELCIFNRPINDRDTRILNKTGRRKANITTRKSMNVKQKNILIKIWDDGQVDEDTISLLVNDQLILENHRLQKEKYELNIQLTKKHNYIVLKAENLGRIPPNTAAISISEGKYERKIELSSDYDNSDAVEVIYIGNN